MKIASSGRLLVTGRRQSQAVRDQVDTRSSFPITFRQPAEPGAALYRCRAAAVVGRVDSSRCLTPRAVARSMTAPTSVRPAPRPWASGATASALTSACAHAISLPEWNGSNITVPTARPSFGSARSVDNLVGYPTVRRVSASGSALSVPGARCGGRLGGRGRGYVLRRGPDQSAGGRLRRYAIVYAAAS